MPHGGGRRLERGTAAYEAVLRWIAGGTPRTPADARGAGADQCHAGRADHGPGGDAAAGRDGAVCGRLDRGRDAPGRVPVERECHRRRRGRWAGQGRPDPRRGGDLRRGTGDCSPAARSRSRCRARFPHALCRAAAGQLHRRPRLGEAPAAGDHAVGARRRRHLPPPGCARCDRTPADSGGGPRVPGRHRAREAGPARRSAAGAARVCRPLGQQVDGPAPAQPLPRRDQGGLEPRCLDSLGVPAQPALRPVRAPDCDRAGEHLPRWAGDHLPRPPRSRRDRADGEPALPGHPARVCEVPPSPVRVVGPGAVLRVRRLLRAGRPQGDRAVAADLGRGGDRLHGEVGERRSIP